VTARLHSLQVGRPKPLAYRGGEILTAFARGAVHGPVALGRMGLAGDEVGDKVNHGGPDMAVCAYPSEHYPYWAERLGRELPEAAFGENFTTEGLLEHGLRIGDAFRIGGAVVQVSQPRSPCYKIAARHGIKQLTAWVQQTGRTGFYLRVLEPGDVEAGAALDLVERPRHAITVAEVNRVAFHDKDDLDGVRAVLEASELTESWRTWFAERLAA
jgi:MOSC domain-containing protein YiiM